jgi:REP element-mobilizing transposase RayT
MGMSRHLRFVPDGGALVEVTCRTIQGRLLLRPSQQLNSIVLGVLGRAQERYPLEIVSVSFLSSHYHLLIWVRDARQLALFMGYFNGNLAREVAHLTGWTDKIWSRRYQAILVSGEEAAQVDRLTYILAQGVKENLVARVDEWPGVHSAHALLTGEPLEGIWHDRTFARSLRLRRQTPEPGQIEIRQAVVLSQLPCWKHLTPEAYRTRVAELIHQIEATAATERVKKDLEPLGVEKILAQDPETRPETLDRSPAPFVHAATRKIRKELWEAYGWFLAAYREAADKLRNGDRNAAFPPGSFPPHLPFVPA